MYESVLGVPVGESMAGVVRKPDGALLFGGTVDARGGVVLTDFRPHDSVVDGRTVVAGRLPVGVTAVTVVDDAGDEYAATLGEGVWVAVAGEAGFSEPLVRFSDAAGAFRSCSAMPSRCRARTRATPAARSSTTSRSFKRETHGAC